MLRVGYPATISADLLRDFPEGIELIPVSDKMDHDVEIDVWIPDPYPTRAMRAWPQLRGVKLVLSLMAGTEWIPPRGGAARDHLQCARRAQHLHRGVDDGGDSGHAEVFSVLSRHSARRACGSGALKPARTMPQITGDTRPHLSAGDAGRADRQDGAAGGLRRHRQRDRAHARAVPCGDAARGAQCAHRARSSCRQRTGQPAAAGRGRDADSALHARSRTG